MAFPVFVSASELNFPEGSSDPVVTLVATDGDGDAVTFLIAGGLDAGQFNVDSNSGVMSFNSVPDYENPTASAGGNTYFVDVEATDSTGNSTLQQMTIHVDNDASDDAPAGGSGDVQSTIDSGAVASMLGSELTVDSVSTVISALAVAADGADQAVRADLQANVDAVQQNLDAAISSLSADSDSLGQNEQAQIEQAFDQLVQTPGFADLLANTSVNVNGSDLTIASLVSGMVAAPKVVGWKRETDGAGNMTGVTATLSDGQAVVFDMVLNDIDPETRRYEFNAPDFAASGLNKSFFMVWKARTIDFGGVFNGALANETIGWVLDESSRPVFDIAGTVAAPIGSVSPDLNNDGQIG